MSRWRLMAADVDVHSSEDAALRILNWICFAFAQRESNLIGSQSLIIKMASPYISVPSFLSFIVLLLTLVWIWRDLDGFGSYGTPQLFNWHALFMCLAFPVLMTQGLRLKPSFIPHILTFCLVFV